MFYHCKCLLSQPASKKDEQHNTYYANQEVVIFLKTERYAYTKNLYNKWSDAPHCCRPTARPGSGRISPQCLFIRSLIKQPRVCSKFWQLTQILQRERSKNKTPRFSSAGSFLFRLRVNKVCILGFIARLRFCLYYFLFW